MCFIKNGGAEIEAAFSLFLIGMLTLSYPLVPEIHGNHPLNRRTYQTKQIRPERVRLLTIWITQN